MKSIDYLLITLAVGLSAFILHFASTRFPDAGFESAPASPSSVEASPAWLPWAPSLAHAQTGPTCKPWDVSKPLPIGWKDNSNNEDGFRVERKLNAGAYSQLGPLTGPNVQSSSDASMVEGVVDNVYTFRIWAFNKKGDSTTGSSNEACVIIPKLITPPAAASDLVLG
jgi:hypothetical protein